MILSFPSAKKLRLPAQDNTDTRRQEISGRSVLSEESKGASVGRDFFRALSAASQAQGADIMSVWLIMDKNRIIDF